MRSRVHRGAIFTLAVMAVLVTSALPACVLESCCANDDGMSLHAQMPCCDEATVTAQDTVRVLPAAAAVAAAELPELTAFVPAPAPAVHPIAASTQPRDYDPPLFLLNEQFLI
ncbi:MAG TPA: hypothetical protein VF432_20765 [Thermoanaerobaculia bacterium]